MNQEKKKEFIVNVIYILIWLVIAYFILKMVVPLLTPFILAFLLAFALRKPIRRLEQKLHIHRKAAVLLYDWAASDSVGDSAGCHGERFAGAASGYLYADY